jgi:phage-related protein
MYTRKSYSASVTDSTGAQVQHGEADISWEGDTHRVIKSFPVGPRQTLGHYLRLVQKGEKPPDSSPVPGLDDVFELRDQDECTWYRVLYLKRIGSVVYVLHCFEKESNQISKKDIRTADQRLKRVHARLMEEKRHAKRQPQAARDKGKRT